MASHIIDLLQLEQMGPGGGVAEMRRAGFATPVKKKLSPSRCVALVMVESDSSVFRERP